MGRSETAAVAAAAFAVSFLVICVTKKHICELLVAWWKPCLRVCKWLQGPFFIVVNR